MEYLEYSTAGGEKGQKNSTGSGQVKSGQAGLDWTCQLCGLQ